jgi:hypothetical protein
VGGDADEPGLARLLGFLKGADDGLVLDVLGGRVVMEIEDLDVVEPEPPEALVELVQEGLFQGGVVEALQGPVAIMKDLRGRPATTWPIICSFRPRW